jgi:MoaA/NifB/PqqE/SkfB family radical SAM enzyme
MAIGISGSNGGITDIRKKLSPKELLKDNYPLEISYFINNACNLKCKHCYVGYQKHDQSLSFIVWIRTFDALIKKGAKTFGNVGKEPLLNWKLTRKLLQYFKFKRVEDKKIRFGFVTNGLLFNEKIIQELTQINPNYIDISLDGDLTAHDQIRGQGTYHKLLHNLELLSKTILAKSIFISFTLNKLNKYSLPLLIKTIHGMGFKNLLISPYVTLSKDDDLYLSVDEIVNSINCILNGDINFDDYEALNIYIKSDFSTSKDIMLKFKDIGIINENELFVDDYGVIFNKYLFGNNTIYFNYLPYDNTFVQAIRISHDGFVSGCLDMFYENFPERAVGNIREKSIIEILSKANPKIKELEFIKL